MKQFHEETNPSDTAIAPAVIEVAWRVMRMVRAEITRHDNPDLTMTQMQSLGYLIANPGASLSEVAEHLGLQAPTTSKVVEELVRQGLVVRTVVSDNRRKLSLRITPSGTKLMQAAAEPAMTRMAALLGSLTAQEQRTVVRSMSLLRTLVEPANPSDPAGPAAVNGTRPLRRVPSGKSGAPSRVVRGMAGAPRR